MRIQTPVAAIPVAAMAALVSLVLQGVGAGKAEAAASKSSEKRDVGECRLDCENSRTRGISHHKAERPSQVVRVEC